MVAYVATRLLPPPFQFPGTCHRRTLLTFVFHTHYITVSWISSAYAPHIQFFKHSFWNILERHASMPGRKYATRQCDMSGYSPDAHLHCFPSDDRQISLWVCFFGLKSLLHCQAHFMPARPIVQIEAQCYCVGSFVHLLVKRSRSAVCSRNLAWRTATLRQSHQCVVILQGETPPGQPGRFASMAILLEEHIFFVWIVKETSTNNIARHSCKNVLKTSHFCPCNRGKKLHFISNKCKFRRLFRRCLQGWGSNGSCAYWTVV